MLSPDPIYPSPEEIDRLMKQARSQRSLYVADCVSAAIRAGGRALLRVLGPAAWRSAAPKIPESGLRRPLRPV